MKASCPGGSTFSANPPGASTCKARSRGFERATPLPSAHFALQFVLHQSQRLIVQKLRPRTVTAFGIAAQFRRIGKFCEASFATAKRGSFAGFQSASPGASNA